MGFWHKAIWGGLMARGSFCCRTDPVVMCHTNTDISTYYYCRMPIVHDERMACSSKLCRLNELVVQSSVQIRKISFVDHYTRCCPWIVWIGLVCRLVSQQRIPAAVLDSRLVQREHYRHDWKLNRIISCGDWVDDSTGNSQKALAPQPNTDIHGVACQIRIPNLTSFAP